MLDANETGLFDEAMRDDPALRKYSHELDRLTAAIAASSAAPIEPAAGQLEAVQSRLKLHPSRRLGIWLAVSGWAAAMILALFLFVGRNSMVEETRAETPAVPSRSGETPAITDIKTPPEVVAKRLNQEIEVLRDNLERFQQRDRVLFTAVPGVALPIVMTMSPPGVAPENSPITTMLGDAMRESTASGVDSLTQEINDSPIPHPSAMPIYDSARDFGTLVVSNLPIPNEGEAYNLWVITEHGGTPIYVGSLPEGSAAGTDSFDFSLGSTMVLPSGFLLTRDPSNAPASPTETNIILQGPPAPAR